MAMSAPSSTTSTRHGCPFSVSAAIISDPQPIISSTSARSSSRLRPEGLGVGALVALRALWFRAGRSSTRVALECVVVRMVPPGASLRLMAVQSFVAVVPSEQPGAVECERDRDQILGRGWSRWDEENSPAEPSQGWLDQGRQATFWSEADRYAMTSVNDQTCFDA